jgi:YVTN family beta-propeller protein
MKRFVAAMTLLLAGALQPGWSSTEPRYKNPFDVAVSSDGSTLLVACSGSDSVVVLSTGKGTILGEIEVGDFPTAVRFAQGGARALVTNRDSDSLSVIDLEQQAVVATIAVGWAPMDLLVNSQTDHVLVANSQSRDISVVDLEAGKEIKRLKAGEGPRGLVTSPDGRWIYLANLLPKLHPPDQPPVPEVTVIDAKREVVVERVGLHGANLVYGLDIAPDGSVVLALSRPKNLLPLVQVAGGWTMTSGIGLVRPRPAENGASNQVAQLLLDSLNRHHGEPTDVAIAGDGRRAAITAAGADEVVIVDLARMIKMVDGMAESELRHLGDRLDLSHEFLLAVAPTGPRPVAVELSPDGTRAYTANRLDDSVTVVDLTSGTTLDTWSLGGPEEITQVRHGERTFFNADQSFNAQVSCGSCHPDANQDGLIYDISPDGLGRNYVDTRTMLGVGGTGPFKWSGLNPSLHRQCGPRAAMFINRSMGFTEEELDNVVAFMWSLELPRNRRRDPSGELTALQVWGKEIFERTVDNVGVEIPQEMRCNFCHSGERFTNLQLTDVGTKTELDKTGLLDTPSLNHLAETAPYLHDGSAMTLEELWTVFSPEDTHGRALDLSKDELNALVEYLKCL